MHKTLPVCSPTLENDRITPFDPAPRDGGESGEDLVKLFDSIQFELGEMPSREERNAS